MIAKLSGAAEELRALIVALLEANAGLQEVIAAKGHQIAAQERRIVELERRRGADSSTSSRPPSSDSVAHAGVALLGEVLGASAGQAARGSGDDAAGG